MARVIEILKLYGAKVEEIVDEYPNPLQRWSISLQKSYIKKLLGVDIPEKEYSDILENVGMTIAEKNSEIIEVEVPTVRLDLQVAEDLIEEIGRIHGYDKVPVQAPQTVVGSAKPNEERLFERKLKNLLVGQGFSETRNYSFYSKKTAALAVFGDLKHLELETPQNPDQELMRVSLIPNLLKNIFENLKFFKEIKIFETGHVFWPNDETLPVEKNMLVGAVVLESGIKNKESKKSEEFFEAKGYVSSLLEHVGIDDYYFDSFEAVSIDTPVGMWHPGRTAEIRVEGSDIKLGFVGEINPIVLSDFDIQKRVAMFEFDISTLCNVARSEREYEPISKYPTVVRDISMIVPADSELRVDEIMNTIQLDGGDLVKDIDLFDMFELEENQNRSYAFHVIFGSNDRTLESKEVDELMKKISEKLEKELGVSVRK